MASVAATAGRARLLAANVLGNATARGAIWSLGISGGGMVLSLAVQVILARVLGDSAFGSYAYALAGMNILLLVGKFDLDNAAIRYVASYEATSQWALLHGFLRRCTAVVLALSTVIALGWALFVAATQRADSSIAVRHALWAACVLLPITAISQFRAAVLQGLKHVRASQIPVVLVRPALFLAGLGVLFLVVGRGATAAQAVGCNAAAAACALVATTYYYRRTVPAVAWATPAETRMREWGSTALGFMLMSGSQTVLGTQTDIVVVGTMLTKADAAHYSTASQLAALCVFGVNAIMFVLLPDIAGLYARREMDALRALVRRAAWAAYAFALPPVIVEIAFGRSILAIFGQGFVAGYPVLLVLVLAQAVAAMVGALAGYLMTMTGHHYQAGAIIGTAAALNLGLTFVLTRHFGAIGTASATAIATALRAVALAVYLNRKVGVQVVPFLRSSA